MFALMGLSSNAYKRIFEIQEQEQDHPKKIAEKRLKNAASPLG